MTTTFCSKGHENPNTNIFCQVCGEKLTPPAVNSLVSGAILEGRYRLVQQIGQGGFGRTYLCEDLNRFNEPCVLKEFAPQVYGSKALDKAKNLFEREANVLYQLQHPQIPKFRESFQMTTGSTGLFLVQDYVAGHTYRYELNSRLQQNQTFGEEEIRQLLINLLPVLEYTHSLGVIHRDIAPDNLIRRSSDGLPILIDFGGVKQIAVNAEIQARGNSETLTRLGKVGYAPHEQMQHGTVSQHSDLYALAATALVLLTGEEPTTIIDPRTMAWNWRKFIQLQPDLGALLDRMLQSKPSERIQSATEVLQTLQHHSSTSLPIVHPSTVGTVVVSPLHSNTPVSSSQITTIGGHGFWQILRRTWIGLLGIGAAVGLGWGATSGLKKPELRPTVVIEPGLLPTTIPSTISSPPAGEQETPKPIVEKSPAAERPARPRRSRPPQSTPRNELSSPQPVLSPSLSPVNQQPRKISSPPPSLTPLPSNPPRTRIDKYNAEDNNPQGDLFNNGVNPESSSSPIKSEQPSVTPEPKPSDTVAPRDSESSPAESKKPKPLF
jgi:serine/threonine protein kinase, bacterial